MTPVHHHVVRTPAMDPLAAPRGFCQGDCAAVTTSFIPCLSGLRKLFPKIDSRTEVTYDLRCRIHGGMPEPVITQAPSELTSVYSREPPRPPGPGGQDDLQMAEGVSRQGDRGLERYER
jgi:hypothetical protein